MALVAAVSLSGQTISSGTPLNARLLTPVSSKSAVGSVVEVVLTAPVEERGHVLLPAGVVVRGSVTQAEKKASDGRALLAVKFGEWRDGCNQWQPLESHISDIDNARETVDEAGIIHGLAPVKKRPDKKEDLLLLAFYAHPVALATIAGGKFIVAERSHPEINYSRGVDLTLVMSEPLVVPTSCRPASPPLGVVVAASPEVAALVQSFPLRTYSKAPSQPSDLTNIAIVGSEREVHNAFTEAGWAEAKALHLRTELKTMLAVVERNGYKHGPVSTLLLYGRPPDIVFQKQNNTFAKRHHIRLWKTGADIEGRPVWVGAATHDIGIRFSRQARTFSHAVEQSVDREREKIVADLRFTGDLETVAWVERPKAPQAYQNATGDSLTTDGRIAVLTLRESQERQAVK